MGKAIRNMMNFQDRYNKKKNVEAENEKRIGNFTRTPGSPLHVPGISTPGDHRCLIYCEIPQLSVRGIRYI